MIHRLLSVANDFVLFFGDKIRRIRRDLDQVPPLDTAVDNGTTGCHLNMFSNQFHRINS